MATTVACISRKPLASAINQHRHLLRSSLSVESSAKSITPSADLVKWDYRGQRQIIPMGQWVPKVTDDAYVASNVVLAGQVMVWDGASIWNGLVLWGDLNKITVGFCSNVQDSGAMCYSRRVEFAYRFKV